MDRRHNLVITIDGPAGSGKSTLAGLLAKRLDGIRLDTGAIYRSLAYEAMNQDMSLDDGPMLADLARRLLITFRDKDDGPQDVFINGQRVTEAIRTPEVSQAASRISSLTEVREALLDLQRASARRGVVVAEGRDMGTVVFPQASVKFFLQADELVRAERRWRELQALGGNRSLEDVLEEQRRRDERDRSRDVAPLKAAPDALIIDSTNKTPEEVLDEMVEAVRDRTGLEV